jgi:hypothetical protein
MKTISEASFFKVRVVATGLIALAIGLLLTWNYYHGGIPSHHILADKTLPKISNLWGALLLPLLTWVLLYRAQKRIFMDQSASVQLSSVRDFCSRFVLSIVPRRMPTRICDRHDLYIWCRSSYRYWFHSSNNCIRNISRRTAGSIVYSIKL